MDFFIIITLPFLLTFVWAGKQGAPWVPSKSEDIDRFLSLTHLQPGQVFYDIGCGDGRFVSAAARAGARAYGFDISLLPYLLAKLRCLLSKTGARCHISYRNFWSTDLRDADVVYFFLMPKIYPRLKEKFERELKPGTKVVAYVWPIDGWTPVQISDVPNKPKLFLYEIQRNARIGHG